MKNCPICGKKLRIDDSFSEIHLASCDHCQKTWDVDTEVDVKEQILTYRTLFDVTIVPYENLEDRMRHNPELTFDELFESNEFNLDECTHLVQ